MKRILQHPLKAYAILLLMIITAVSACKKDDEKETALPIKVKSYFPNSGNAGTLVTIEGENLVADVTQYSATVAGKPAEVVSATSGYLVIMVPAGTGNGKIELKHGEQTFDVGTYTYQSLSLRRISPNRGPIGTNIRISGEGFSDPNKQATVTINGNPATIISLTDTLIITTVPANTSTGPVEVKVNDKSSVGPIFRVQAIFDILPKTGGKGTHVTLKGSGFETEAAKNIVTIKGKPAQVVQAKEDELIVIAPDGVETGRVDLRIDDSAIEGPNFTVVPAPTITAMTPQSGPAGTQVKITGANYSTIAGETKVTLNDKDATITAITATEITLTVPASTGTGAVKVSVNDQVVTGPVYTEQAVGISGFTPENGNTGTIVTITGVGFSATPSANTVTFNGIAAQVTTASATQLTVVAPPGVTNGFIKVRVNGVEATSHKIFQSSGVLSITTALQKTYATSFCAGLNGEFYVVFTVANGVYKVAPNGTVSLYVGNPSGGAGDTDGIGTAGRLRAPNGIVCDSKGNLFVSQQNGNIRKITPNGMVTTFATGANFSGATGIAIDGKDYLYIGARENSDLGFAYISPAGVMEYEYNYYGGPVGRFGIDPAGKYYASDVYTGRFAIGDGTVEPLIGNGFVSGYADGGYNSALFGKIGNMIWSKAKDMLLVCDPQNNALRYVNANTRQVGTIFKAGKGFKDGGLADALFGDITDVNIGPDGTIYVLDKTNGAIRKVTF